MRKLIATISLLGVIVAAIYLHASREVWPTFPLPERTQALLALRAKQRLQTPLSFRPQLKDHTALGDYLNYGNSSCDEDEKSVKDSDGVLRRIMNGEPHYHPVIAAQCGLMAHGRLLRNTGENNETTLYADNLISLQTDDGAYRYPFPYRYYLIKKDLPAGWTSAMAQGQAMSLMARAFNKTGDTKYLQSGVSALRYLITPVAEGGVMTSLADLHPSLSKYIFFEEYVSEPANYTLNGYMFTLLGLYDWSKIDPSIAADQHLAAEYFSKGIKTLTKILPYYDLGSWTSYDLGYITFAPVVPNIPNRYHAVHIYQLHALHSITKNPTLQKYRDKWMAYAED